ncbi:hypothetical protein [Noviherbaspirillum pedocola]|uniref:Uncharacterized protein n=1 Tax=Noviherbaspirillum pedocola TaxID=2801341 RepID=A0A934W5Z4_9BURK|nr:hypothetical protein [Noviherbaspirillum pedocola]MBK4734515.1 hypothetical protein [Noviherbaspirillum pedocola]
MAHPQQRLRNGDTSRTPALNQTYLSLPEVHVSPSILALALEAANTSPTPVRRSSSPTQEPELTHPPHPSGSQNETRDSAQ